MIQRVIIRNKSDHAGGHNGGAWKVAYADFVTAMMALFIVLWLLNTSKQVQEAVGGYFRDPNGTSKMVGTSMQGSGENYTLGKEDFSKLEEHLRAAMKKVRNFDKFDQQIEMTLTSEGLRIELLEQPTGTFFDLGSPAPTENGRDLLTALAVEIGKLPNKVSIEGHTDSLPYGTPAYSNWELSTDRANAARRLMREHGLREDQVAQVRGFADQRLRNPANPSDSENRRISLIIHYLDGDKNGASAIVSDTSQRRDATQPAQQSKQ